MKTDTNTKEKEQTEFDCAVCGQTKEMKEANYNCTGEIVCDDCQPDYYRH